jgi:benzylsuccinate CoA-transferase BbsF subunit
LACNLKTDGGRRVAARLVEWADVVVESFSPGTMDRLGLGYNALAAQRPDLIMLSTSLRGQTGPDREYAGFGYQGAAISGLHAVTGWPDRPPCGPWGAYTDFIAPRFGVAALASALIHRARTGRGQWIDLAQTETAIRFVEPMVLLFQEDRRRWQPMGHSSSHACPHGVFATLGNERYIAISCETNAQWESLRTILPGEELRGLETSSFQDRDVHRDSIAAVLREWCSNQDAFELASFLQGRGVPAHAVLRPSDLYGDSQLRHRAFFVELNHPVMGRVPYDGLVTKFSRTPGRLSRPGPCFGEHSSEILVDLLGFSDEDAAELAIEGALS